MTVRECSTTEADSQCGVNPARKVGDTQLMALPPPNQPSNAPLPPPRPSVGVPVPPPGVPAPAMGPVGAPRQAIGVAAGHIGNSAASGAAKSALWMGAIALAADLSFVITSFIGPVLGFVLGVLAWSTGNQEIKRIQAGQAPAAGLGPARTGKILGIVAATLAALGLIAIGLLVLWFISVWT